MGTIEVKLSDEEIRQLEERARQAGTERAEYGGQLIREALVTENDEGLHPGMTLDEILAPVRREFAERGMTEDELLDLIEQVREEVWQEKQGARGAQ